MASLGDTEAAVLSLPTVVLVIVKHRRTKVILRLDGWVLLFDKVYDVTEFLRSHPCGEEVVMEYLGCDATLAFRGVTGHTSGVIARYLQNCILGILPDYERLGLSC